MKKNINTQVGLAPETLRRSNLGYLSQGNKVNLERSLAMGSRNSGHFVQGHVDCVGKILSKTFENDSLWIKVLYIYLLFLMNISKIIKIILYMTL